MKIPKIFKTWQLKTLSAATLRYILFLLPFLALDFFTLSHSFYPGSARWTQFYPILFFFAGFIFIAPAHKKQKALDLLILTMGTITILATSCAYINGKPFLIPVLIEQLLGLLFAFRLSYFIQTLNTVNKLKKQKNPSYPTLKKWKPALTIFYILVIIVDTLYQDQYLSSTILFSNQKTFLHLPMNTQIEFAFTLLDSLATIALFACIERIKIITPNEIIISNHL
jgi:hypothetical protein